MKISHAVVLSTVASCLCTLGVLAMLGMQQPVGSASGKAPTLEEKKAKFEKMFVDSIDNAKEMSEVPRPTVCSAPKGGTYLIINAMGGGYVVDAETARATRIEEVGLGGDVNLNCVTGFNFSNYAEFLVWESQFKENVEKLDKSRQPSTK